MAVIDSMLNTEVLAVRQRAGYALLSDLSVIELRGKDAESFLQGRSSNDARLKIGSGQLSSLLDRKGSLIAFLSVHRNAADNFWLISDSAQSKIILDQFKTYHFREQIEYEEIAEQLEILTLQGPASESFIASVCEVLLAEEYSIAERKIADATVKVIRRTYCGDSGFLLLAPKNSTAISQIVSQAKEVGIQPFSLQTLDALRIEAGQPQFGIDMSTENLLPETGLEQYAASYNKGCFQGQEVLARIKTYGAPRRALVGLVFDEAPAAPLKIDTTFTVAGEEQGLIKSNTFSPSLDRHIALAYIARDHRLPDHKLTIEVEGKSFPVTVKFLPFYSASSSKARARKLYDEALQEFAHGSEEKAIVLLRTTIELDPLLVDAYESLGVILSRHEQYDEAIALMHKLQSLDPDSVMSHTNLSVYYMQLGDKDRAEEEKAIAMSIRMAALAREHAKQKKETVDREKMLVEAENRLSMFRQVLAIDPEDFLANNGVGTVFVELGKYEESLPYLHKVIAVKPTHTVAYLALGQAYEKLGRIPDAVKVYNSGIEVAAKRGDITPMKEMQSLLAALKA